MTTLLDSIRAPFAGILPGGGRGGKPGIDALRDDIIEGAITQSFGATPYVRANPRIYPSGIHDGVDIVLPHGPSGEGPAIVHSPFSGRVVQVQDTGRVGYGKNVVVRSAQGYTMLMGHLQDQQRITGDPNTQVRVGDDVWAGEPIGHMGATGSATGPHVHYRLHSPGGVPVDPTLGLTPASNDGGIRDARYADNTWYAFYHDLGFGQGDNPGQEWRNQAPAPTQLLPKPTTLINGKLNPNPGIPDPEGEPAGQPPEPPGNPCPQGQEVAKDEQGNCPTGYQPKDGFYWDPKTQPCTCSATYGNPFNFDPAQVKAAGITAGIAILGILIIVVGIVAFSHEQPVQAVVQPVADAGKSVAKGAALVAK